MRAMRGDTDEPERDDVPPGTDPNMLFYQNAIESRPDGAKVEAMHASWGLDYERLEMHHGYIQWIFPVFENAGMNWESSPLTKDGARTIRDDAQASERVLASYRMMLKFYGFVLADERTGAVQRDPVDACGARIGNLNASPHNFLRVSRILTSLGELGFHRYKKPLLEALQREVEGGLLANARASFHDFWLPLSTEEDSARYAAKTKEVAADRAEGCLFAPGGRLAAAM